MISMHRDELNQEFASSLTRVAIPADGPHRLQLHNCSRKGRKDLNHEIHKTHERE